MLSTMDKPPELEPEPQEVDALEEAREVLSKLKEEFGVDWEP
ncbi:hypothetical protein [Terricaulis sp.]|nr:hypothetical protein [Terricaulis sp.]MDZ4692265.1 hypothetical protein [Terricaulis sp.]